MITETVTSYSSGKHLIDLDVVSKGMVLTIGPGSVRVQGVDYDCSEAFEFVASSHDSEVVGVCGYLVREVATGALDLLVDQTGGDFPRHRYEFDEEGPYERLALLFSFKVPPQTRSLDAMDETMHVYKSLIDPKIIRTKIRG